jgi:hypothetical protein
LLSITRSNSAGSRSASGVGGGPFDALLNAASSRPYSSTAAGDQPLDRGRVGDVGADGQRLPALVADARGHLGERALVPGAEHDGGAGVGERPGGDRADAAAGAGDQRHLPHERPVVGCCGHGAAPSSAAGWSGRLRSERAAAGVRSRQRAGGIGLRAVRRPAYVTCRTPGGTFGGPDYARRVRAARDDAPLRVPDATR